MTKKDVTVAETSHYRKLTTEEITALRQQGCSVAEDDWNRIEVADGFQAALVENVRFDGDIQLGALGGPASGAGGAPSRLRNARLVNCRLGNHVRVENIGVRVSGYEIGDGAAIENVGLLESSEDATFGNGVKVEVLNEGGGREVILFDQLSSQFAHMLCLYRYRPEMVEKMQEMVAGEVGKARQSRGRIGAGARVRSTSKVVDVRVGAHAVIDGAAFLENGSILSSAAAPTEVGAGVEAHDFIIAEGARVDSAAMLSETYVGQACRIGRQFSAEGSLFFANCEAFHGEACSVFAGPYTVTHHKGSLLIAGMFSFYNAGSGTNQSNHMYKLGPVHEGRLERGSKTGSFSYMMWPCRVGPFSVVLGKHSRSFDTGDFPFSHVEALPDGRCSLVPGFNLTTVGTVRDGAKWPSRDRRAGSSKRDRVSFDVFSPYTVGRMLRGIDRLQELQNKTDRSVKIVTLGGADVKRVFLRTGQKLFRRGSLMYLAEKIVQRVEAALETGSPVTESLGDSPRAVYCEQWVDVGGQLMPAARLTNLVDEIADGTVSELAAFNARLDHIHKSYPEDEWVWVKAAYQRMTGVNVSQASPSDLAAIADTFLVNRKEFLEAVLIDALKEFEQQSAIGFGTDGPAEAKQLDFQAVRGDYDSNKFVVQLRAEIVSLVQRVERLKEQLCPSRS